MKAKQISDTTMKITISMNDLEERGMALADFVMPQEKTEDFFYAVLDEVDLPEHFKHSGMLSFRVTPKKDKVDIFVTKSDLATDFDMSDFSKMEELSNLSPEEFFKNLEKELLNHGDKEALKRLEAEEQAEEANEAEDTDEALAYIHFVLAFSTLTEVIAFADLIDAEIEASELYKYQGGYRLTVLVHVEHKPKAYPDYIYARLLEHAEEATETRAFLREHGLLLREGRVLEELAPLRR